MNDSSTKSTSDETSNEVVFVDYECPKCGFVVNMIPGLNMECKGSASNPVHSFTK